MNIFQNLLTGLARPILNKSLQSQNILNSFSTKPNNQMGPTYPTTPTTTKPIAPINPVSPILPKTNTPDTKKSTISSPIYNPTANVINQNALNNISEQNEQKEPN